VNDFSKVPKRGVAILKKPKKKPMPILSFWGSVWFGEKPKNQKKPKKTKRNQCQFIISQKPKTKKSQKKTKKNQKKNQCQF
jgi:hypothetical protein